MPAAAVVICHGDLTATVDFVARTSEDNPTVQMIVVNNGPSSDSEVRSRMPATAEVIGPPINRGYSRAANAGIEKALELGLEDVVILPNDGEVPQGALERLHREAQRQEATIAGPLVLYQGSDVIWADGLTFDRTWGIARNTRKGERWPGGQGTADVEYVTGHAILLRDLRSRPWLRFDEDLFIYYEDVTLCDAARSHGGRVIVVRDSIVYHNKPGMASYRFRRIQERHMARSGFIYWAKHVRGLRRITHLTGFLALTAYRLTRAASLNDVVAGLGGLLDGAIDAVRIIGGRPARPPRV